MGAQLLVTVDHVVERTGRRGDHFLGHVRDTHAARQAHVALVRAEFAQQQFEQGGLARAVAAGDTDVLAVMDGEGGVLEQQAATTPHRYRV
jgi:hypothetical protein